MPRPCCSWSSGSYCSWSRRRVPPVVRCCERRGVASSATPDSVRLPPSPTLARSSVLYEPTFSRRADRRRRGGMCSATRRRRPSAAPTETTVAPPLAGEADGLHDGVDRRMMPCRTSTAPCSVPPSRRRCCGSTARVSEPRLYRVGDRAGGYRVAEIADRSVTLIGPGGRIVLELRSSP